MHGLKSLFDFFSTIISRLSRNDKIQICLGLDPAGPGFEIVHYITKNSLSTDDAQFVDVIHTAGGTAGYYGTLGHADFYPNGGTPVQPGCENGTDLSNIVESRTNFSI